MVRLNWDEKPWEAGVSQGVYYPLEGPGEAWNGLISVEESPDSFENATYLDGIKTRLYRKDNSFLGSLSAFSVPPSFYENLMSRQRYAFGMSYRVETEDSYEIHILYNVSLGPTHVEHSQNSPGEYSWELSTKPIKMPEGEISAHLFAKVSKAYPEAIADLEAFLYGSDEDDARLPTPEELHGIFENNALLKVVDNGDGTFTVTGPDEAIVMLDSTTFQITWPSAIYINSTTYKISSF